MGRWYKRRKISCKKINKTGHNQKNSEKDRGGLRFWQHSWKLKMECDWLSTGIGYEKWINSITTVYFGELL